MSKFIESLSNMIENEKKPEKKLLFLIDCDRDRTTVHRIDLNLGQYLMPKKLRKGSFTEQVVDLTSIIEKDMPVKIVIDEFGLGKGFSDAFGWRVKHPSVGFSVDMNGNIKYK